MMRLPEERVDYLVIGSGIAGLRTAIGLSRYGRVRIVTKASVKMGSSFKAQGGVAVVLSADDRFEYHIEDTLKAGAGLCDEERVRILVEEGPARIRELVEWGVRFDIYNGQFLLSLEGAHSHKRIIHAMGDATGREIERALIVRANSTENIELQDQSTTLKLLKRGQRVVGILVYDERARKLRKIYARATVLATGGIGQIYTKTTNPRVSTGDGVALAYDAGAAIQDMEFVQFHPTALYERGKKTLFLISEAVRGAGAYLRNLAGHRFMKRYDPRAELASRDIVARAIFTEMQKAQSDYVYLDMRHLSKSSFAERFPTIFRYLVKKGYDIKRDLVPVCPVAHFAMGGVLVDENGRSTLPGLYAVGEVASVGVHGANRLASNSLLECLVFGHRAAEYIGNSGENVHFYSEDEALSLSLARRKSRSLSRRMQRKAGIVRIGSQLSSLLQYIEELKEDIVKAPLSNDINWRAEYEYINRVTVAYTIVKGAFVREESRGAHFRKDFPEPNEKFRKHYVITKNGEYWR